MTETVIYNLRFPGMYYMAETGLFYNGDRTYDPTTGRYLEPDRIGLAGASFSTYAYANANPVGRKDMFGLQVEGEGEEEEEETAENRVAELVTRSEIDDLVTQIRRYDPNFQYSVIAPPGYRYGRQDIDTLESILNQYKQPDSCPANPRRIDYGKTPNGVPFSRHYGTEAGPIRNIPGSLIDSIIDTVPGIPGANNTTVYFDPVNNVTVVTGNNGIVSAHRGPP